MKIHFIAIGGSAMHNLAIALHQKGYAISGSDDEVFEPSKSHLAKYGLLPARQGWFPENIASDIDAVILGMHARPDNPELLKAQELGMKIFSYPEFVFQQSKNKTRIVIAGSHGKTTITSMIMHVLKQNDIDFDYLVGASLAGYETMVKLSESAKYIVLEGDEYLSSPIDREPKFIHYQADIAVLSGIAWDHINVFPSYEIYFEQFLKLLNSITNRGKLYYYQGDPEIIRLINFYSEKSDISINNIQFEGYSEHKAITENAELKLVTENDSFPIKIFGAHNLQNISAAKKVCCICGVSEKQFYIAISNFTGASRRLEKIYETAELTVFLDFAHAPSKAKATIEAIGSKYPDKQLVACLELHTFSSLNAEFLPNYNGCFKNAAQSVVYFNPKTIEHKKLQPITKQDVIDAFGQADLQVITEKTDLEILLKNIKNKHRGVLLLMSSGNFSGINFLNL